MTESILASLIFEVESGNAGNLSYALDALAEYLPQAPLQDRIKLLTSWARAARERAARRMGPSRHAQVMRTSRVVPKRELGTSISPLLLEQEYRKQMREDAMSALGEHLKDRQWYRVRLEPSERPGLDMNDPGGKELILELMFEPMTA